MSIPISIIGTGKHIPKKLLTNKDLEKMMDTSDEWIKKRTGIQTRYVCDKNELTSDIAEKASIKALENANIKATDLDMIIMATTTPDMLFPSTACILQKKIGATNAVCFDVSAACSGYVFAQSVAEKFFSSKEVNTILVIGAEKMSKILDWSSRNTSILFGDGAGAVVFAKNSKKNNYNGKILSTIIKTDGRNYGILNVPGSSISSGVPNDIIDSQGFKSGCIYMSGQEVYRQAVHFMKKISEEVMKDAGITSKDISLFIPHQANIRIINAVANRLEIDKKRVFINLEKYGNTSAASIPIALDEAIKSKKVKSGDIILFIAFGAGTTWGGSAIKLQ